MKQTLVILTLFEIIGMQVVSCANTVNQPVDFAEEELIIQEDFASTSVDVTLTDQQKNIVADNNAFTLKFLKMINDADKSGKSFVYSPLSITYVLSMVNTAAEGTTRTELQNTLGFGNGEIKEVNGFCKTLIDGLPKVDTSVQIHIANAIYVNKDYTLKKRFQQDMKGYYGANAESLDFSSPKTLNRINGWCNSKTNGLIPRILNEVDPEAVSYLLNAIYFKAAWVHPFKEHNTKMENFTTANGTEKLPMMCQNDKFLYMKNEVFAAVDLPYGDWRKWRMTVILPEKGKNISDVIDYLAKEGTSFLSNMKRRDVDLKLPRFETESTTDDLIGTLKKMGIIRAFDGSQAEIRNMCNRDVYISNMLQKAHIKVDENGSEAAAVTETVVFACVSASEPKPTVVFHADHPFVYLICDASSDVILFVGKFTGM